MRACGPICQDLYGNYPRRRPRRGYPAAAKKIAQWTAAPRSPSAATASTRSSTTTPASPAGAGRARLLVARLAQRDEDAVGAVAVLASPATPNREVDTDGDGLPDTLDNSFTARSTNPFFADTDGDCFDDDFEVRHRDDGFRPDVKDGRGCDPASPLTPGCMLRDTDGDGLSQFAEAYLKTRAHAGRQRRRRRARRHGGRATGSTRSRPTSAGLDTDGDGIPDATELRGSARTRSRATGVLTREERLPVRAQADQAARRAASATTSRCRNIQLVTPPNAGRPARRATTSSRCGSPRRPRAAWPPTTASGAPPAPGPQYDPPSVRVPAGPQPSPCTTPTSCGPSQLIADPAAVRGALRRHRRP